MVRSPKKSAPAGGAKRATGAPPAELLGVERLAYSLGVAASFVELLCRTRGEMGVDFVERDGVAMLTAVGAQKMRGLVETSMQTPPPDILVLPASRTSVVDTGRPALIREDLRLTRVFPWSANILAELPNGLEVVLTVRSNKHLERGMVLRGCIKGEMGWIYDGRLPRSIGERQLYYPTLPAEKTI